MRRSMRRVDAVDDASIRLEHPDLDRMRLTQVTTEFVEGRCNHRLLFGQPQRIVTLRSREGWTRQRHDFVPGSRFALDLWKRNRYGTVQWRCLVCESLGPSPSGDLVPFVVPAVRVLLDAKGAAQSWLFLAWLMELEKAGTDLLRCPAERFEAAHFRLQGLRADRTPARRLSGVL